MAVTVNSPGPYTATSAMLEVITRYRTRGLPSPITAEVLGRAGVSESLIPRTLQAMETLDLIDDKGAPTPMFEGLRLAPEAEFKKRMAEWLNAAYADVLQFIDPATADEVAIRDAFRAYNPVGQQPRMVTLFQGLYAAAGVGPERHSAPRPSARVPKRLVAAVGTRIPQSLAEVAQRRNQQGSVPPSNLPPAVAGMLSTLPSTDRGWTKQQRDGFYAAFGAVLDYTYPIVETLPFVEADDEGDE